MAHTHTEREREREREREMCMSVLNVCYMTTIIVFLTLSDVNEITHIVC